MKTTKIYEDNGKILPPMCDDCMEGESAAAIARDSLENGELSRENAAADCHLEHPQIGYCHLAKEVI